MTTADHPKSNGQRPNGTGSVCQRNGRGNWYIAYMHAGRQVTQSTKQPDKRVAEKKLREKLRTAGTATHVTASTERLTFDEVAALLVADYKRKGNRTLKKVECIIRQLREAGFGGPWLAITTKRVEDYKTKCLEEDGEAKGKINRRLSALRRMGRLAMRTTPPLVPSMPYVTLFDESDNVREGFVDPADFTVLRSHLPEDIADGAEFAYFSAWRSQMVWGAMWSHCDLVFDEEQNLVGASIRLPRANVKNKQPHSIPLRGRLHDIIQRRWAKRAASCPYIFHRDGRRIRRFRTPWAKACEAAGLPGLWFYDLKRSAARNMRRTHKSEHVICKAAGWRTQSMFRCYDIVDEADLAELFEDTTAFVEAREKQPRKVAALADARRAKRAPTAAVNLQ